MPAVPGRPVDDHRRNAAAAPVRGDRGEGICRHAGFGAERARAPPQVRGVATEAQLKLAHKVYREGAAEIGVELCREAQRDVDERSKPSAGSNTADTAVTFSVLDVDEHEEAVVALPIDTTLFNGLEFAMTEEEQRYVTKLMVSGDPSKLAQAAQILAGISELMMKGITPSMRCQNAAKKSEGASASAGIPVSRARSGGTTGRNDTKSSWARGAASNAGAVSRALAMAETDTTRAQAKREAEIAAHRRMHPLPSRMPRYVTLNAFDPAHSPRRWGDNKCPLTFADDEWDGSIADAFARVSIGRGGKVVKGTIDKTKQKGVHNVLVAGGGSKYETHLSSPSGRVVIASSFGQAGRSGIQKGDVVTHINGEEFIGNSDVLRALIGQIWAQEGTAGTFSLVVNAEPCTAEVSSWSCCWFGTFPACLRFATFIHCPLSFVSRKHSSLQSFHWFFVRFFRHFVCVLW